MGSEISLVIMLLTGISLAMDAFAVSISCGLSCNQVKNTLPTAAKVAMSFGFFQGMMVLLGWALGLSFKDFIGAYDHWVAFILLAIIGGKMMYDAIGETDCPINLTSNKMLLTLSIATSIDALAVGVSFSVLDITLMSISTTAYIVAIVTFLFCFLGTYVGSKVGCNPRTKTTIDIIGGLILVGLGMKILLEGTIFL